MADDAARRRAMALPCWSGPVEPRPLGGGISNTNFVVEDGGRRYVVRIADDVPVHCIVRARDVASSRAAHAAGIAPEVVHVEPGAMVIAFVQGRTLEPADVAGSLDRIVPLVAACHRDVPRYLRGPAPMFWVFHALRDYAATLIEGDSRLAGAVPRYLDVAARLERAVGPIDLVFGHNDLLAANFIDDGERIWLIDWEYAGFNSPLFDLGNLASNNELDEPAERHVLELYHGAPADDDRWRRYSAMKCASLLREAVWSMVSELHSHLDFDYVAYTEENLARFERALAELP